jgi:DNA (cytosine-5)-methyltransferase 1
VKLETFFDFCSGIGGGRLGLEQCGMKSVGYSDTSRLSVTTYNLMHDTSNENNFGNLKKIKIEDMPSFDLLIAGFPCQTFSVIGRKAGFDDTRGQIIFHLARIIKEVKPKCFILENVKGLVTHDKGTTLETILKLLYDCGYLVSYKVLSSIDFGTPQMRQRVFFIGVDKALNIDPKNFSWPEPIEKHHLKNYLIDESNEISEDNYNMLVRYLNNPTNQGKYSPNDFLNEDYLIIDTRMSDLRLYRERVPTLRSHRDGIFYVKNNTIKELTGYEALLLQGFPKSYADKVKNHVSNRHLLMQAGNAMTVNVIKELGNSLISLFNNNNNNNKLGGITMAATWQQFEDDCLDFLTKSYGSRCKLSALGKSDSTQPDIKIQTHNSTFYVEVKEPNAQSGQFVLIPDENKKKFIFSPRNKTEPNEFTDIITSYMNTDFERFNEAGTAGQSLNIDQRVFSRWITNYYKTKGVKYFITKNTSYIIFPISKFETYFDITATYRIKRSGSSEPSKKYQNSVITILKTEYGVSDVIYIEKKLFVKGNHALSKVRFTMGNYEYYLAPTPGDMYEVRQLSNTYNMNVIFSIKLKKNQDASDLKAFESEM